jgi:N-methylhydantoinase A
MKRFGIDIGGTFTDIVIYDDDTRHLTRFKVLSTPDAPEKGILEAFAEAGLNSSDISHLIHGTTLVTNLIIERNGARVGLITTRGYRDILEIMRAAREIPYDLHWVQPRSVVPRRLRLEVEERIDARGHVVRPLNVSELRSVVGELLSQGVEAIAICFLHAYINPVHEQQARSIVRTMTAELPISISSEVCPQIREYERTSTTVLNSYSMPRVDRYVRTLDDGLSIPTGIKYLNSEAGLMSSHEARRLPITLCLSGPAGGVLAGQFIGKMIDELANVITMDMGGTSLDICLIRDGQAQLADTHYVQWGIPIKTPNIDVTTIGAGGGSIVWIDDGGAIRVGPRSAGAIPGPACYCHGGTEFTVTDANMILGILNPNYFLGGQLKLDRELSLRAAKPIAETLRLDVVAAAEGVFRVVNANMSAAIRQITVERGIDPREFMLIAFGGAGGQHAVAVAREIGIREVLLPNMASVLSAFGMVTADMRHSRSRTLMLPLKDSTLKLVRQTFEEMETGAVAILKDDKSVESISANRVLELRYEKQAHEIPVDLRPGDTVRDVYDRFEKKHRELYGTALGHKVTLVTLRSTVIGQVSRIELRRHPLAPNRHPLIERQAHVHPNPQPIPVIRRPNLDGGMKLPVPCLIEEVDSVHYIPPGCRACVDAWLNVRIVIEEE